MSPRSPLDSSARRASHRRGSILSLERLATLATLNAKAPKTPAKYDRPLSSESDSMLEVSKAAVRSAFHFMDADRDERVTLSDVQRFVRNNALAIPSKTILDMFSAADTGGYGKISLQQLLSACSIRKEYRSPSSKPISSTYTGRPYRSQWIKIISAAAASEKNKFKRAVFERRASRLQMTPILTLQERSQFKPNWARRGSQAQWAIDQRPKTTGSVGIMSPIPMWSRNADPMKAHSVGVQDTAFSGFKRKESFSYSPGFHNPILVGGDSAFARQMQKKIQCTERPAKTSPIPGEKSHFSFQAKATFSKSLGTNASKSFRKPRPLLTSVPYVKRTLFSPVNAWRAEGFSKVLRCEKVRDFKARNAAEQNAWQLT